MSTSDIQSDEYSLLDYWAILRRRWVWVLAPLLLCLAAATYYTVTRPDTYVARAQVLLADTAAQRTLDPSSQNLGFLRRELSNEISLARSDLVRDLVEAELGRLPEIDISSDDEADLLVFTAAAGEPDVASNVANVWAGVYVQVKQDQAVESIVAASSRLQERLEEIRQERQELRSPLDELQDEINGTGDPTELATLQARYDRLTEDLRYELDLLDAQSRAAVASLSDLELQAEVASVGEARIVQQAAPPAGRANAPLSRNLVLASIVGLIAGAGLALLIDSGDDTISSATDLQGLRLPLLAAIPEAPRRLQSSLDVATQVDPSGAYADGYQKLRSAVDFMAVSGNLRSVLVTSANAAEGKSTTASNLAIALSEVGRSTILADVDFRRGRVHQIYNINRTPGLADFALGRCELRQAACGVQGLENLAVLPLGSDPPNPASFVGTAEFQNALAAIASGPSFVVIDAPPLLAVSDTHSLVQHADAVILTARVGKTKIAELRKAVATANQVGAAILGVVLIGAKGSDAYESTYYQTSSTSALEPAGGRGWNRRSQPQVEAASGAGGYGSGPYDRYPEVVDVRETRDIDPGAVRFEGMNNVSTAPPPTHNNGATGGHSNGAYSNGNGYYANGSGNGNGNGNGQYDPVDNGHLNEFDPISTYPPEGPRR